MSVPYMPNSMMVMAIQSFYNKLLTIRQLSEQDDSFGQEGGTYVDVVGLINKPCIVAPIILERTTQIEQLGQYDAEEIARYEIAIPGAFRNIIPKMIAVVGGVTYNIVGAEWTVRIPRPEF